MAPASSIVYVGAPNNDQDLDSALNHVVDQHLADIVTNSYGWAGEALPPGFIKPYNDTLIQASAEGIRVLFSSGDSGDETFEDPDATPSADFPASSPWVTAAGGTSLGVDSSNGWLFELGWQTGRAQLVSGATARSFDQDDKLTIHVRPGYDDVTGLGTPNGQAWLNALQ
jgi:subtilase family serine protease